MIAPEMLNEERYEQAEGEEADTKGGHRQSYLERREMLHLHQPSGHRGHQHVDCCRQQRVGDGHQPDVTMPETDMYGGILGIHERSNVMSDA